LFNQLKSVSNSCQGRASWGACAAAFARFARSEQRLKQMENGAIDQNDAGRSISEKSSRYFS
jgi:hypothetical protein